MFPYYSFKQKQFKVLQISCSLGWIYNFLMQFFFVLTHRRGKFTYLFPRYIYLGASIPALLLTILLFMDQQITSVIVNRKEHKLKVTILLAESYFFFLKGSVLNH